MLLMCRLGRELGKTLEELGHMTTAEMNIWLAFFKIEQEELKRRHDSTNRKTRP